MSPDIVSAAIRAKTASRQLALLDTHTKNEMLERMAASLEAHTTELLAANRFDVEKARGQISSGALSPAAMSRLTLTGDKLRQMSASVRAVAALQDPVRQVLLQSELDEGLELKKITCPFGVIAAVVEARPDAVVHASPRRDGPPCRPAAH